PEFRHRACRSRLRHGLVPERPSFPRLPADPRGRLQERSVVRSRTARISFLSHASGGRLSPPPLASFAFLNWRQRRKSGARSPRSDRVGSLCPRTAPESGFCSAPAVQNSPLSLKPQRPRLSVSYRLRESGSGFSADSICSSRRVPHRPDTFLLTAAFLAVAGIMYHDGVSGLLAS